MKTWLLKFFGEIGEFLKILLKEGLERQLKIILPIATKYVKMIAADPSLVSGREKQAAVFNAIISEIGDSQEDFKTSIINLAIEMAVVEFKALQK